MPSPCPAIVAVACLVASVGAAGQSRFQPLPPSPAPPLPATTGHCACLAYEGLRELHRDQASIAFTGKSARLHVDGQVVELAAEATPSRPGATVKRYRAGSGRLLIRTREIDFAGSCSIHPDPPPHGTCHDVQATYHHRGGTARLQGKLVCDC